MPTGKTGGHANLNDVNGAPLKRDESKLTYAIIRHNIRTYQSAGVVEIIKGRENAEASIRNLQDAQTSEDRQEGWRYFCETTSLRAGMDPQEATHLRQADLDNRESQASADSNLAQN